MDDDTTVFTLRWSCGAMEIYRDQFFPATKGRFAKLLKLFPRDVEERRYLLEENKTYIEQEIRYNEDLIKRLGSEYRTLKDIVADDQRESSIAANIRTASGSLRTSIRLLKIM